MDKFTQEEIDLLQKVTGLSQDAVKRILYDVERTDTIRTESGDYHIQKSIED